MANRHFYWCVEMKGTTAELCYLKLNYSQDFTYMQIFQLCGRIVSALQISSASFYHKLPVHFYNAKGIGFHMTCRPMINAFHIV